MSIVFPTELNVGTPITDRLIGTNLLFNRNDIGPDGTFDEVAEALQFGSLRYHGGAISESLFDIRNPDSTIAYDPVNGNEITVEPISDVLEYAAENNISATIVIPTRTYLTEETDALGHRFAVVDEEGLRDFVTKLVSGEFGAAKIEGLEIGNEYWGIGDFPQGSMTSLEYARIAADMVRIFDDTLATVEGGEGVCVLVQMGTNYGEANLRPEYADVELGRPLLDAVIQDYGLTEIPGLIYSSVDLNWAKIANEIIIQTLQDDGTLQGVDGVVAHIYSRYPVVEGSRDEAIDNIEETWGLLDQNFETWITEWSQKSNTSAFERLTDYGLNTAHELIDMVGIFVERGVTASYYWTAQHNTRTTLARLTEPGDEPEVDITAVGHAFAMLRQNLIGLHVVDPAPRDTHSNSFVTDGIDSRAYAGQEKVVFYFANEAETTQTVDVDLGQLVTSFGSAEITRLGVEDGQDPGNSASTPVLTDIPETEVVNGTRLTTTLNTKELLQVVLYAPEYDAAFTEKLDAAEALELAERDPHPGVDPDSDVDPDVDPDPDLDPDPDPIDDLPRVDPPEDPQKPKPEDDGGSDIGFSGLAEMLPALLLPLIFLLAGG